MSANTLLLEPEPAARGRRRSIATRGEGARAGMIRFVLGPEGTVVPDLAERLGGRGLWLEADRARILEAIRKNLFAKAVRAPVRPAPDLLDCIERGLRRRCLDLLGLARRAGAVVAGHDQVEAALRKGGVAVLLLARDAAGEAEKLARRAGATPAFRIFERDELGAALGREHLVYVAVLRGALADRLLRELSRLSGVLAGARADDRGGNGTRVGGDDR
ncbi:MAG: RNA-binding protein [Geminicoccaceae bacterium]|nr:RNA-binding protein [Geminicoccaceae bacterium]